MKKKKYIGALIGDIVAVFMDIICFMGIALLNYETQRMKNDRSLFVDTGSKVIPKSTYLEYLSVINGMIIVVAVSCLVIAIALFVFYCIKNAKRCA